jgi:hypothetical protein
VYTAQLSIHKAFLYTDDPFVDFEQLVHVFGKGAARPAASQFEEEIKNTNIWYDCWADKYQNPVEVFDAGENLSDLIFSTYCLLDDPAWVQKLKDSGFDGAIYGGCGESACELEYRVFSLEQVKWWERKYV